MSAPTLYDGSSRPDVRQIMNHYLGPLQTIRAEFAQVLRAVEAPEKARLSDRNAIGSLQVLRCETFERDRLAQTREHALEMRSMLPALSAINTQPRRSAL
jgi:hypothetical protein